MATELEKTRIFNVEVKKETSTEEFFFHFSIKEYNLKEAYSAIQKEMKNLYVIKEQYRELYFDVEDVKTELSSKNFKIVSEFEIDATEFSEDELHLLELAEKEANNNICVHVGIRGQYVIGFVKDKVSLPLEEITSFEKNPEKAICAELVEDYLIEIGVQDERYIAFEKNKQGK